MSVLLILDCVLENCAVICLLLFLGVFFILYQEDKFEKLTQERDSLYKKMNYWKKKYGRGTREIENCHKQIRSHRKTFQYLIAHDIQVKSQQYVLDLPLNNAVWSDEFEVAKVD